MNFLLIAIVRILEAMFVIGAVGCTIAIPLAAWKMFSVLLERDDNGNEASS